MAMDIPEFDEPKNKGQAILYILFAVVVGAAWYLSGFPFF
jgi:hypothetical protein